MRDLAPDAVFTATAPLAGCPFEEVTASLFSAEGKALVSYRPVRRGQRKPIEVREPVRRPCEYETVEELYLNGYHLEQYKQHNYDPRDYYREGLRRDPGSTVQHRDGPPRAAGRQLEDCIAYCDKAIQRLTSRNQHPTDTESPLSQGAGAVLPRPLGGGL